MGGSVLQIYLGAYEYCLLVEENMLVEEKNGTCPLPVSAWDRRVNWSISGINNYAVEVFYWKKTICLRGGRLCLLVKHCFHIYSCKLCSEFAGVTAFYVR